MDAIHSSHTQALARIPHAARKRHFEALQSCKEVSERATGSERREPELSEKQLFALHKSLQPGPVQSAPCGKAHHAASGFHIRVVLSFFVFLLIKLRQRFI